MQQHSGSRQGAILSLAPESIGMQLTVCHLFCLQAYKARGGGRKVALSALNTALKFAGAKMTPTELSTAASATPSGSVSVLTCQTPAPSRGGSQRKRKTASVVTSTTRDLDVCSSTDVNISSVNASLDAEDLTSFLGADLSGDDDDLRSIAHELELNAPQVVPHVRLRFEQESMRRGETRPLETRKNQCPLPPEFTSSSTNGPKEVRGLAGQQEQPGEQHAAMPQVQTDTGPQPTWTQMPHTQRMNPQVGPQPHMEQHRNRLPTNSWPYDAPSWPPRPQPPAPSYSQFWESSHQLPQPYSHPPPPHLWPPTSNLPPQRESQAEYSMMFQQSQLGACGAMPFQQAHCPSRWHPYARCSINAPCDYGMHGYLDVDDVNVHRRRGVAPGSMPHVMRLRQDLAGFKAAQVLEPTSIRAEQIARIEVELRFLEEW